jgi:hypothetical protein
MITKIFFNLGAVLMIFFSFSAHAEYSHLGSEAEQRAAESWNKNHPHPNHLDWKVLRPFGEAEKTGFVAITAENNFELPALREAIAKNLPPDVTLVVYVTTAQQAAGVQKVLGAFLNSDRLKFLKVPATGDRLWARDALPFPVYFAPGSTFGLVASRYPQNFDPNPAVADAFGLPMVRTQQFFRGGNLLFDVDAHCFAENVNEVAYLKQPSRFFKDYFGCASITLLKHEGGIGDIDERIKILNDHRVLTDNDNYARIFQGLGYDVRRIPSTGFNGETYMNTLLVNGTIFVPQMGLASDSAAVRSYRDLGFTAVPVFTKSLADRGDGNIHCVTMNYPPGTFRASTEGDNFIE